MMTYDDTVALAARVMPRIVDGATNRVLPRSVTQLDSTLRELGFRLVRRESYGPSESEDSPTTGRQLFYRNGRIVVRLKTEGDAGGFRRGQAHLSAAINDGHGLDWFNDMAKLSADGGVSAKAISTADRYQEVDFQKNPNRFIVILGGRHRQPVGGTIQNWADRVHFPCPPEFSAVGVENLRVDG